ncbi:MAG TPA: phage tail protein [Blastocatellia bacterium]|nr:phage tail protein [Blastocatellia bacterium]
MSCGGGTPTFRLLDPFVGWDQDSAVNLSGLALDDLAGVQLSLVTPDALSPAELWPYLAPPRLVRGCGGCEWFLLLRATILRRDCCTRTWHPIWSRACDPRLLVRAVALARRRHRLAVSDAGAGRVWIWEREGEQLSAAIRFDHPGPLTFTPQGELLVADSKTSEIRRFGHSGEPRGRLAIKLPAPVLRRAEVIDRLAAADDCSIWIVTRTARGALKLWRAGRGEPEFVKTSPDRLPEAFNPNGLVVVNDRGFCLEECGPEGSPVKICSTWQGEPAGDLEPPPEPPRHRQGQLLTSMIDSGIPRCHWHRVRIEAELPPGTGLQIAVATGESDTPQPQGDPNAETGWEQFPAGIPHPHDWQEAPAGSVDFLINQPPGRYLFVRLRLRGDGQATPVVRRIRLDLPRVTSLEFLPPVYRDTPEAEDFTERFLALFDSAIADLDRAISRAPALLDIESLPDEALPWLAGFLDLVFDPVWEPERRRRILRALPELYRLRGTIAGLTEAIRLVFDVDPVVRELALERSWGALRHNAQLGAVRLFGRAAARFRLDGSALDQTPLRSYGNPDHDPLIAQAHRFRVLVPPRHLKTPLMRERLARLIESQKPAHTVAAIGQGGDGFIVGTSAAVGVETVLAPLPPPVLGRSGNIRLNRTSILWHEKRGLRKGIRLGETAVVGLQTIIE